jgi:hypothetical protein
MSTFGPVQRNALKAVMGILVAIPACAFAQTWSEWGAITSIDAGPSSDSISLHHSAPLINPGTRDLSAVSGGVKYTSCRVTNAGYSTEPRDEGRDLYHTIALAALLNRKEVQILVQGCTRDKPRLIGIRVR